MACEKRTKKMEVEASAWILGVPSEIMFWDVRASWRYYSTCKEVWASLPEEVRVWSSSKTCVMDSETVMQWFLNQGCFPSKDLLSDAASTGNLKILEVCRRNGVELSNLLMSTAAQNGRVDVLEWLYENEELEEGLEECMLVDFSAEMACVSGYLGVVKWMHSKGCIWNNYRCARAAATGGHLELLKWLRWEDWEFDDSLGRTLVGCGLQCGHLEVLKFVYDEGFETTFVPGCSMDSAVKRGHLECLKFVEARFCSLDYHRCAVVAARHCQIEVLSWLRLEILGSTAAFSNLDDAICEEAASRGHVGVLKFVKSSGLMKKNRVRISCRRAAKNGHLAVLQYLHCEGYKFDKAECAALAASGGHELVETWCCRE